MSQTISQAATITTLVNLTGTDDSAQSGGLVLDANGNLIATTWTGGTLGDGTVFEIAKSGSGFASTATTLVAFNSTDGANPFGLISDANGNLLGMSYGGGTSLYGNVFEIAKTGSTYAAAPTTLYNFTSAYGLNSDGGLFLDSSGNIIGTTTQGGSQGYGSVFEIAKSGSGYASAPTTVVSFNGTDGAFQYGGLITDSNGDLFGTTSAGGTNSHGTVFEIAKTGGIYASTPTVLVNFGAQVTGTLPTSSLIIDANGNLFGTTEHGGAYGYGSIFEIVKTTNGYASSLTTLASFNGTNGSTPESLIIDAKGDLFGTTGLGGTNNDGSVFELVASGGVYASTISTVANFTGANGSNPQNTLVADASGNLFGLTSKVSGTGGNTAGTVFEVTQSGYIIAAAPKATAAVTGTLSFGQTHAGTAISQALTITNKAVGHTEGLDANFSGTSLSSGAVITSGTLTGLGASSTDASSLLVTLNTSAGGKLAGVAYVTLASDGTGIDIQGTTSLGIDTVALSGTVFNYATASVSPTTVAFGQSHAGGVHSQTLILGNAAVAGVYSEGLDASFSGTTGSITTTGSLTTLAAGATNTSLVITEANTAGVVAGFTTLNLTSDGKSIDTLANTALTSDTFNVTGTLFNLAAASTSSAVSLGQHHVGSASTVLTLSNSAAAGLYSENLDASFVSAGTGLTTSGLVTTLAAGGTDTSSLNVTLNSALAGNVTGTVTLALSSDGAGIDSLGTTSLASHVVTLTETAYALAAPSFTSTLVNLGITHIGGTASTAVTLVNGGVASSYIEKLDASFISVTGTGATDSGSLLYLASGATSNSSLKIGIAETATGVFTGNAVLSLTSDGTGIDTLGTTALANETLAYVGTVDNYATAAVTQIGGAGTLIGSRNNLTLALGTLAQGAGKLTAGIAVLNSAIGQADVLGGGFTIANASGAFSDGGFGTFSGLGVGQADILPTITLSGTSAGVFAETITLSSAGSNTSAYSGALANLIVTVTGTVLSDSTYALTTGVDTISGTGNDLIVAQTGQLSTADVINAGTGLNTLALSGGGTFDMRAPFTLSGISVVKAAEGVGAAAQTLYLDTGFAGTVNVTPGGATSSIAIHGNLDSATINLGSGDDTVYVGSSSETVNGGTGHDLYVLTSATSGATLNAGTGTNTVELTGTGVLNLGTTYAGFQDISFASGAGWTLNGGAAELAHGQTIAGFSSGDTLVLSGISTTSYTQVGNTLVIGGDTLDISGAIPLSITAGPNGTTITAACFTPGTRIATPRGDVAVEELQIGDEVLTLQDGAQPIKWIGRRAYAAPFSGGDLVRPVTIRAGALEAGLPQMDLVLSPGHALYLEESLVHTWRLINGASVKQEEEAVDVSYIHLEFAQQQVIFANGCAVDSFHGEEFRAQFQNAAEFAALYPDHIDPQVRYTYLEGGFELAALQARLNARAGIAAKKAPMGGLRGFIDDISDEGVVTGWARDEAAGEMPVVLKVTVGRRFVGRVLANTFRPDLRDAGIGKGCHGFTFQLPANTTGKVEVLRAADGAALELTDTARERAA